MSTPNTIKCLPLSGIIDGTRINEVRQAIAQLQVVAQEIVVIDLAQVEFMDSSGLSAIIMALKQIRAANAQLCLCALTPQVQVLFDLTSMDRLFPIYRDRAEFEASL
jgi:anti-sigma B factor antagonist